MKTYRKSKKIRLNTNQCLPVFSAVNVYSDTSVTTRRSDFFNSIFRQQNSHIQQAMITMSKFYLYFVYLPSLKTLSFGFLVNKQFVRADLWHNKIPRIQRCQIHIGYNYCPYRCCFVLPVNWPPCSWYCTDGNTWTSLMDRRT